MIQASLTMVYLGLCYLSVSPLFITERKEITLNNAIIATAMGVLFAGLIFVLAIIFAPSIDPILGLSGALILLSIHNIFRFRQGLIPVAVGPISAKMERGALVVLTLVLFGGTSLVGYLLMGQGDYPAVFFNGDIPNKVVESFSLVGAGQYPPSLISVQGVQIPYHYGASASVAALSVFSGISIHKAMFWVVGPMLLIGSVVGIARLTEGLIENPILRFLAMISFLPMFFLGSETSQLINLSLSNIDSSFAFLIKSFSVIAPASSYNPQQAGGGVLDLSVSSGILLLICSFNLLLVRDSKVVLVMTVAVVIMTIFCKMDYLPAVAGVIAARALMSVKSTGVWFVVGWATIILAAIGGFVWLFSYFDTASASGAELASSIQLSKMLGTPAGHEVKIMAIFLAIPLFLIAVNRAGDQDYWLQVSSLLIGVLLMSVTLGIAVSSMNIPKVGGQFLLPRWITGPIALTVLISCLERSQYRWRVLIGLVLAPLLTLALAARAQNIHHFWVIVTDPPSSHEYSNNHILADALKHVPLENSLIVTNDFRYLHSTKTKIGISALWGHEAFGVQELWRSPIKTRSPIQLQKRWLSSHFRNDIPIVAQQTLNKALKHGWTHFLYHKFWHTNTDANNTRLGKVLPPREAKDFPLEFIYENEEYIVMKFPDHSVSVKSFSEKFWISTPPVLLGSVDGSGLTDYAQYVLAYEDLEKAWAESGEDINQWGKWHWTKHGERAGRSLGPTEDSEIPTMTLHREPGIVADHVACVGKSAYAEGQSDLVLSLDIDIPEDAGPMAAITHIKLKRSHPVGINDTNDQNSLLGVSLQPDGPLLNHPNGRIQLRNPASIKRVWLFACTDGQDQPDSIYWAEVRLRRDMP